MRIRYYTNKEWNALSAKQKLAFGAGNVHQVRIYKYGKWVTEWEVKIVY